MVSEHFAVKLAKATPMYGLLRRLRRWHRGNKMRAAFWRWSSLDESRARFYSHFISAGDLAFDVGANMGNRSKVFVKLGARVVAVEPQQRCADVLDCLFCREHRFSLVRRALGAQQGTAQMLVGSSHVLSTLSRDWVAAVRQHGRFGQAVWHSGEVVSVDTLDHLIDEFGMPSFIKVDVEGYEGEVLNGLSRPVPALSVEFTPEFLASTLQCVDHLCSLGEPEFQVSLGESMCMLLPRWVSAREVTETLGEIDRAAFGDLYARFQT